MHPTGAVSGASYRAVSGAYMEPWPVHPIEACLPVNPMAECVVHRLGLCLVNPIEACPVHPVEACSVHPTEPSAVLPRRHVRGTL